MNILIAAKLSDYKLKTTLEPLIKIDAIQKIYLIRRTPISGKKLININPPKLFQRSLILSEIFRIFAIFWITLSKKIDHLIGIHFYYHCIYVAIIGMICQKPFIFSIVESPEYCYKNSRIFRFFARRAKSIAVRGTSSENFLEEKVGLDSQRTFVLPDVFHFLNENTHNEGLKEYDLVFTGHYVKEKRIDVLLEVISELKNKKSDVRLALIGQGPLMDSIKEMVKELGLTENVDVLGYVDDIYSVLKRSRVFIMTSQTEGLPTALIEAFDCGLPAVVPNVGDMTDLANDQYNALVVESLNVQQFSDACYKLLEDQNLYNQLVSNVAKTRIEKTKEYSLENVSAIWQCALEVSI